MTSIVHIQASSSICSPATAASSDAQGRPEDIDWEERRWQMEWERRNIED